MDRHHRLLIARQATTGSAHGLFPLLHQLCGSVLRRVMTGREITNFVWFGVDVGVGQLTLQLGYFSLGLGHLPFDPFGGFSGSTSVRG